MIDAVFISDLHLSPNETKITERFEKFIQWAAEHTRAVYILGDFFHVWIGDDGFEAWSEAIADQLAALVARGVTVYFMPGNRDFLIGSNFVKRAQVKFLAEPTIIHLGGERVLLVHGDRYCTDDKSHQWLRRITRRPLFSKLFLALPLKLRHRLVHGVRDYSQENRGKTIAQMDIVVSSLLQHMQELKVQTVIHGHIHRPGLTKHRDQDKDYKQYVLSDWDDNPSLLCYNESNNLEFKQF